VYYSIIIIIVIIKAIFKIKYFLNKRKEIFTLFENNKFKNLQKKIEKVESLNLDLEVIFS
jgi:hypothetical protein